MKNFRKIVLMIVFCFMLTGCFKSEELDKANIYTTVYPIEYLTNELYGYNSEVNSIYPDGVDVTTYKLSNKKIKKYSKEDLFVYNGLTDEKQIAADFVNKNGKLKIIDVSEGLAIKNSFQELWLNPTNYLMMAQNIKNGLNQYIDSTIIKDEINANYTKLKVTITEFETSLKLLQQNGKYNTIIVSKDYLKFLENYGFEVISLEETDNLNNDTINKAKNLLSSKENSYIFVTDEEKDNYSDTINDVKASGGEIKVLNTMTMLTKEQRDTKEDYTTLMKENLELLKEEVYK